MTATDEPRLPNDTNELDMLLSERGQEHRVWPSGLVVWHDERTAYEYEPAKNHHDEYWGGILRMTMRHLTPEQAIAATLGSVSEKGSERVSEKGSERTVRAEETERIDTRCYGDPHGGEVYHIHVMECSACGRTFEHVNGSYEYCPHCRARLEE